MWPLVEETFLWDSLDPYKDLFKEKFISLDALSKKSGYFRFGLAFGGDEIEVVVMGLFLVDESIFVKCLELIADHETFKMRIS